MSHCMPGFSLATSVLSTLETLWQFTFTNTITRLQIAYFQSIFTRSASAVTHSKKSSVNTNRKSHTGFRLILSSMTLNDLERSNSPYFAFFSRNSIALMANYVTMVEYRPIMSAKYCLPVSVFHFWPKLTHPAAWSLCDSWDTCKK